MENQKSNEECIALCRKCAYECTENARLCKDEGMDECARLCTECAAACNQVVLEGSSDPDLYQECAIACNACATECESMDNPHCESCAKICRECEDECNSIAA